MRKEDVVAQKEVEKFEQTGLPRVHVKKFKDEIPVKLNEGQDVEDQIDNLCSIHGETEVFVDGVSCKARRAAREELEMTDPNAETPPVFREPDPIEVEPEHKPDHEPKHKKKGHE
jgi:hypothetical protein